MITQKEVNPQEHSSIKLNVTIDKDAVKKAYDELLDKYSKTAHIKGFRKGKVPTSVLERKFGDGIKQEASVNLIEESLKEIFKEIDEKPLPYSTPELQEEIQPELDQDLSFSVVYDTFPDIQLGDYKGLTIDIPAVELTEEDEQRELKNLQERNAIVVDKSDATVAKDSIVTIDYVECDDQGNEIESGRREGFVFTVGSGYNLYKIDEDIVGMKKDEERIIEKEYPADYEYEELQGKKVRLKVTVTAVKEKQLPELDDEFAQDVSEEYETLDDLKAEIRKSLEEATENRLKEMKIDTLIDKIIENSTIDLPHSMLNQELENSWRDFIQRMRGSEEQVLQLLEYQGKTKEDLFEEWKPAAERRVRAGLLIDKMIEKENIEISDEEREEEMQKYADDYNKSIEEIKEQFSSPQMTEYLDYESKRKKLFDMLLEENTVNTGEQVNFLDLMGHNH